MSCSRSAPPASAAWRSLALRRLLGATLVGSLALAAPLAHAAGPGASDPTLVLFELYYAGKDYSKTPEYVEKVQAALIKEGGFDVVARADAEKPIREKFPASQQQTIDAKAEEIAKMVSAAENKFYTIGPSAAIDELRQAQTMLQRLVDAMSLTDELKKQYIQTQMLLALVYLRNNTKDKAEEVVRQVVRQVGNDPSINTDNYHPDVVALFRDIYRELSAQRNGTITVRSNPPAAEVYLNGLKQEMKTPATFEGLFPGEVLLQVRKDGKESRVRKVIVKSGEPQEFDIDLDFEAALNFDNQHFGLTFVDELDRKRNLPKFAARLGELVDADYVAVVGLGEGNGEDQLEGYLVHVETEKLVRGTAMPTRSNVVAKRRTTQMARYILFEDAPTVAYKPWYENTLGWVLTGVGVAGGVLGTIFYLGYQDDKEIAECVPPEDGSANTCRPYASRLDAKDSAESERSLAYASWGVGGAALIGGILAFALMEDEDLDAPVRPRVPGSTGKSSASVTPVVTPDGGGISASFSF